jgi:hypothetical protein
VEHNDIGLQHPQYAMEGWQGRDHDHGTVSGKQIIFYRNSAMTLTVRYMSIQSFLKR